MSDLAATNPIVIPAGWQISPGRETSRPVAGGGVASGLAFTLTGPENTQTSIFIPYSQLANRLAVQAVIDERIANVSAITQAQTI